LIVRPPAGEALETGVNLPVPKLCPGCAEWFDPPEFRDRHYTRQYCRKCRIEKRIEKLRRAIAALEIERDARRARIRGARACAGEK